MDALVQFRIPVSGLKDGLHSFDFQLDSSFFECFEASPIEEGNVEVKVSFDKRPDLYVILFDIKGKVKTTCDRCLDEFFMPIENHNELMVKFDEKEHEDADIVYILRGVPFFNIAKYIYEFINLAVPMMKTHDDAEEDCNEEMMKYIKEHNEAIEESEEESVDKSVWDALKNFKEN